MSLGRILVLAVAIIAIAIAGGFLGGVLGFFLSLIAVVLAFFLNSIVGDQLRRGLRRLITRLQRPTFSYDLLVRLRCDRLPSVDEVITEVSAFLELKTNGRIGIRGGNYVQLHMSTPPDPISVEWHAAGDVGEEDENDDLHTERAPVAMMVTPAAPHIVDLRSLRGPRTQELASVLWEVAMTLQQAFAGRAPEILITVNRVKPGTSARPVPPMAPVVRQRTNGSSITRGSSALQIHSRSVGDAIRHLSEDVIDLEPIPA